MELLTVSSHERAGWTVVTAAGQLDVATAPAFRQTLLEVQYGGGAKVALELSGLEFVDSFGLGVVVGGMKRARTHGGELAVVCPAGRIRHVFELTGIDRLLPVVEEIEALDRLSRAAEAPARDPGGPTV